ncbi:hypothetical protein NE237_030980 [Protea cynaroides]|uniref:Uncharacterized protein n=1 Tax=Protea cynaroides TaxID=273540 RepID=A0A9Q0GUQ4_9MAGN|nr:hypothetical protein NE237_030980 [Protea cynaroides]
MDVDIARWILEFIIRQPIEDRLLNDLVSLLPVSNNDIRLKKTILLRRISSEISTGSVSETILDCLEMIEELDYTEGKAVLDSMKAAYCAVAVDCTVKFLKENLDADNLYFNAVSKIWRNRIHQMEIAGNVGLVSEQLKDWKEEIEAATWDDAVCEKISMKDTRYDAVKWGRIYLEEAWEDMGPSFLELAVPVMMGAVQNGNPSTEAEAGEEVHLGLDNDSGVASGDNCGYMAVDSAEKSEEEMLQPVAMGKDGNGIEGNKYDVLPSTEVGGVLDALKSSCMELRALVNDPLPDALDFAAKVVSDVESNKINVEPLEENPNRIDAEPNCLVDEGVEAVEAKLKTHRDRSSRVRERNNTYEWDDESMEISPEASPSSRKFNLPSPKKRVVTPLKKNETKKIARRKIKKWSSSEEDTLRIAVQKYGRGNWKMILSNYREIFEGRTEVDLKDKWRNMIK